MIIDPIDGSLNARRTIPLHSVSIAVADGDSMADVTFGYVYEFGAREEFVATLEGTRSSTASRFEAPRETGWRWSPSRRPSRSAS